MVRKSLILIALLSSCSAPQRESQSGDESLQTFDVDSSSPSSAPPPLARTDSMAEQAAAPGVDVTAAPGVAFDYRYAFRLPTARISAAQEAHAQMCEKLGLDRCRITGMRYRLVNQRDISAMLALRLDPLIARQFGKDASAIVTQADGMLVDLAISGDDVGTRITASARSESGLREDLAELEAELARLPARDPRRGELIARAEELRRQIRALGTGRDQDREALAGTPMIFNYGSGSVVPGFDVRSPVRDAIADAGANFLGAVAAIIVIVAALVPWLVIAGLLLWLFRRLRGRFGIPDSGYRDRPAAPPVELRDGEA